MGLREKINLKLRGYKKALFLFAVSYIHDMIANRNKKIRIKENKKNGYIENRNIEIKNIKRNNWI